MKRKDLARALAQRNRLTEGEAQDQLDRLVHAIVTRLRQGRAAEMPGVGKLTARLPAARRSLAVPSPSPQRRGPQQ